MESSEKKYCRGFGFKKCYNFEYKAELTNCEICPVCNSELTNELKSDMDISAYQYGQRELYPPQPILSNYGKSRCRGFSIMKMRDWGQQLKDPFHISFNICETKTHDKELAKIVGAEDDFVDDFDIRDSINYLVESKENSIAEALIKISNKLIGGNIYIGNFSVDGHAMAIKIVKGPVRLNRNNRVKSGFVELRFYDPDVNDEKIGLLNIDPRDYVDGLVLMLSPISESIEYQKDKITDFLKKSISSGQYIKINGLRNIVMMNLFEYTNNDGEWKRIKHQDFGVSLNYLKKESYSRLFLSDIVSRFFRKRRSCEALNIVEKGMNAFFIDYKDNQGNDDFAMQYESVCQQTLNLMKSKKKADVNIYNLGAFLLEYEVFVKKYFQESERPGDDKTLEKVNKTFDQFRDSISGL